MALPVVHRYLLDTAAQMPPYYQMARFPQGGSAPTGSNTTKATNPRETTVQWSQKPKPAAALALLPDDEERKKALKYFKPADAALSIASSLLKHLAIVRLGGDGVTWASSRVTQEREINNGKPFFKHPAGGGGGDIVVEFNASHHGQAGVVAGCGRGDVGEGESLPLAQVGVDVVHVDLERGRADLLRNERKKGGDDAWARWVDIFDSAFSKDETAAIKRAMPAGADWEHDDGVLEGALRVFHAYWALKEAYIKMTGEAFMADWLTELEFRNVRTPRPLAAAAAAAATDVVQHGDEGQDDGGGDGGGSGKWAQGETVRDIQVWLRNERLDDVTIEIQAVGKSYMIATAVSRPASIAPVELIDVERDLVPLAKG